MPERVQVITLVRGQRQTISGPPGRHWYVEVRDASGGSAMVQLYTAFSGFPLGSASAGNAFNNVGPDQLELELGHWASVETVQVRLQRDP